MRRVYYAHCIAIYDTPQEQRDINLLESLGLEVLNPNEPETHAACDAVRRKLGDVMELVFKPLVSPAKVDAVVFRALPDGRIPAGVAKELEWAKERGLPILELPTFAYDRVMSLSLTRTYLKEIGER